MTLSSTSSEKNSPKTPELNSSAVRSAKLGLGTAQFGQQYGIANRQGVVPIGEVAAILGEAWSAGIQLLDTAISYGESEYRLGQIGVRQWQVVTKIGQVPENCADLGGWVRRSVEHSLSRLQIPELYGLLLHRPADLLGPSGDLLYRALVDCRLAGLVKKIGVSIYEPAEWQNLSDRYRFDLVQSPLNLLDRRMIHSGQGQALAASGVEWHTRSVFLQGLLLMKRRPRNFYRWNELWARWEKWENDHGTNALTACLAYVLARPEVAHIIVGVDSTEQIKDIIAAALTDGATWPADLWSEDPELLNPSLWSKLIS